MWMARRTSWGWRIRLCDVSRADRARFDGSRSEFYCGEYLRERLEEEDERPLYDVFYDEVLRLIEVAGLSSGGVSGLKPEAAR